MPRRVVVVDPSFPQRLRELLKRAGMSYRDLAKVNISRTYGWELANGKKRPTPEIAAILDRALDAHGELTALVAAQEPGTGIQAPEFIPEGELDALELVRRVTATDIGEETLAGLEAAFDHLAISYPVTPPGDLLALVRRYLSYVTGLVDARRTLDEHRRLLVVGGWLSLLAATLHIDLKQTAAGRARLATAASLARDTGQTDICAWCLETRAWAALTGGDFREAVELAVAAQRAAPRGSSAMIQATAQEGRAQARLGARQETYAALDRVARLASPLIRPEHPQHHYRYDPDKALSYTATTLAWIGDPAAEGLAREVIAKVGQGGNRGGWPRRLATAQIDLGLALIGAEKYDEAAAVAQSAIVSGRIVPSSLWRALEIVQAVEHRGLREARDLREAFETLRSASADGPADARDLSTARR
jgi:transcriptional regulator with XRE-family HTH domain